MFRKYLRLKKV